MGKCVTCSGQTKGPVEYLREEEEGYDQRSTLSHNYRSLKLTNS